MNVMLWTLQVVLALVFVAHGWLLLAPPANLIDQMNASMSPAFRLFLGVAEVAAAVGLILPPLARVMTWLVPAAAAGIAIVLISATIFHLLRAEWSSSVITAVLLVMAVFVGYERWRVRPVAAPRHSVRAGR